jgi:hypothetical protein
LWQELEADILAALTASFGTGRVQPGNKAIKVQTGVGRMEADVLPCFEYRAYEYFRSRDDLRAYWGVAFFDSGGAQIENFPRYHIDNGQAKNAAGRTNGWYKPTIRVVKNFRNWLVDRDLLGRGVAPSYFLECALYNVPDTIFTSDYSSSVPRILNYLLANSGTGLICQNGVVPLVGNGPTMWSEINLFAFAIAGLNAWSQ